MTKKVKNTLSVLGVSIAVATVVSGIVVTVTANKEYEEWLNWLSGRDLSKEEMKKAKKERRSDVKTTWNRHYIKLPTIQELEKEGKI